MPHPTQNVRARNLSRVGLPAPLSPRAAAHCTNTENRSKTLQLAQYVRTRNLRRGDLPALLMPYSTLQLQHSATHCNALQHTARQIDLFRGETHSRCTYITLQQPATHCNALQHTATHCNTLPYFEVKLTQDVRTTHCNNLQHTATHCNTLQRTATHCLISR